MEFRPHDIGIWLENIDVNHLTDAEAEEVSRFDISTDDGMASLICDWIVPRFATWDEHNQGQMKAVLAKSLEWSDEELSPVFREFSHPTGAEIEVGRFLSALRRTLLP